MDSRTQQWAAGILCGCAIIAPLLLGASGEWARLALEVAIGLAAIIWAATAPVSRRSLLLPVMMVGLLGVQLLPLSGRLLQTVAPLSAERWQAANQGSDRGGDGGTISVDPSATALGLRRLFLGLAVIAVASSAAGSAVGRRRFTESMALSGVLILALGLAFPTTSEDRILLGCVDLKGPIDFWLTPIEPPVRTCGVGERAAIVVGDDRYTVLEGRAGDGFGPFIYSNHYAAALCLTVPAILACLLASLQRRVAAWVPYAAAALVGLAAVAVSAGLVHSKAGAAALVFGVLTFFCLVIPATRWRSGLRWATAACGIALLLFQGIFYGVLPGMSRFLPSSAQPFLEKLRVNPRIGETAAAMRMFRGSPIFGTGLDTYGPLNAVTDPDRFISFYAHNEYAQWLSETGLLGAMLGVLAAFVLLRRGRCFLTRTAGQVDPFFAAAWGAVAGIAVHSAFDWNLQLPANSFLACAAVGLCLGSGAVESSPLVQRSQALSAAGILPRLVFCSVCIATLCFLARDAAIEHAQRRLRMAIAADRLRAKSPDAPDPSFGLIDAMTAGESAARWDPANSGVPLLLGQASLHLATRQEQASARDALRQSSTLWMNRARAASAALTGIPERD